MYVCMYVCMYVYVTVKLTCNSFPGLGLTPALSTRISICPNCVMVYN